MSPYLGVFSLSLTVSDVLTGKIIYEALRVKTDPQRCKGGPGPAIRHYIM